MYDTFKPFGKHSSIVMLLRHFSTIAELIEFKKNKEDIECRTHSSSKANIQSQGKINNFMCMSCKSNDPENVERAVTI